MYDVVGFLATFITSLLASGVLASVWTTRSERKKRNSELQLERLEKALALVRKDFDEFYLVVEAYFKSPASNTGKEFIPSVNPLDMEVALMMSGADLDVDTKKYIRIRSLIPARMSAHTANPETREHWNEEIEADLILLKDQHDRLIVGLIGLCQSIMGTKKRVGLFRRLKGRRKIERKMGRLKVPAAR